MKKGESAPGVGADSPKAFIHLHGPPLRRERSLVRGGRVVCGGPHPLQCAHWSTFPVRGEGKGVRCGFARGWVRRSRISTPPSSARRCGSAGKAIWDVGPYGGDGGGCEGEGWFAGTSSAPVCALEHLPRARGRQGGRCGFAGDGCGDNAFQRRRAVLGATGARGRQSGMPGVGFYGGTGDDPLSHGGKPPRQLPRWGSQGRAAGRVGPCGSAGGRRPGSEQVRRLRAGRGRRF